MPLFDALSSRGVFGGVNDVTFDDDVDDGVDDDGGGGAGPFSFLIIYEHKENGRGEFTPGQIEKE